MANTIVDRKLWLTADRERVVEDGDPDSAFLFATPGDEITEDVAKRYGLKQTAPRANKQAAPPATK